MADEFVNVLTMASVVESELATGRLESEGIPVLLKGEGLDAPYPTGPCTCSCPRRSRRACGNCSTPGSEIGPTTLVARELWWRGDRPVPHAVGYGTAFAADVPRHIADLMFASSDPSL
jgi:hypothetical protein